MCVACSYTIHRSSHHFGWNRDFAPAKVAKPGETIHFECLDSSGGQIGPDAKDAGPALIKVYENNAMDPDNSKRAADALKKIDPEAAKKAGVK